MKNSAKDRVSQFLSEREKKILKISLISGAVIVILVAGIYTYINHANKMAYSKYLEAKDLYVQAEAKEEGEKMKELKRATALFKEVIANKLFLGSKEEAFIYLINCLYELGDYDEDVKVIQNFEKRYPRSYFSPWMRLKMALIYEQMGKYKEAKDNYKIIREKYAQSSIAPEALLGEARCQEALGNKGEAIKIYQNLVSRYPLSYQAKVAEAKLQDFSQKRG